MVPPDHHWEKVQRILEGYAMTDKEIIQAQRICFRDLDDGAACPNCPLYGNENCLAEVMGGAADLLEWLSGASADLRKEIEWKDMVIALAQRKQAEAEAERDAALADLADARSCKTCKYACDTRDCSSCKSKTCKCRECHLDKNAWEWRGLPETPEEGEKA
jgi:hypothetical protein